jgi:hypothetical protein
MLGIVIDAFRPPLLRAMSRLLMKMMNEADTDYISNRRWILLLSIHYVLIAEHHGKSYWCPADINERK